MTQATVREFESSAGTGWRRALSSLQHSQFRWLYASNMAFMFAMMGQFLVRSVLAFDLTGSEFALGIVNVAVAIPMLIISPIGGALADRLDRRKLIIGVQLAVVADEFATFFLIVTGLLEFWHLVALTSVLGGLFPFMMPARQAIVVNVVGKRGLGNAMALQMGGMNGARVIGPVTAGFLVSLTGIESTYAVALVLYGIGIGAMIPVRPSFPDIDNERHGMFRDIVGGFKYVRDHRPVRVLLLLGLVPTLLAMPFQALLIVFAEEVWDVGTSGFGLLQMAAGLGGLLGSVYVAWIGESHARLRRMMGSLMAFGSTLFLFSISPWFLLALPLVLFADIWVSVFMTLNNTAIQILIPDWVRGRVMSLLMMSFGLTPLGTLPMAAFAEAFGAPAAVALASALMIVAGIAFYFASGSLRSIDSLTRAAVEAEDERERAAYARERDMAVSAAS